MSQHLFSVTVQESAPNAGATARGRCGWDPRLQQFFMSLVAGEGDNEEMLYNTLFLRGGGVPDPQDLVDAANAVGISFPAGLFEALEEDSDNDVGNSLTNWTEAGPEIVVAP
jgi:hypothetical protein